MQLHALAVHRSHDLAGEFSLLRPTTVAEACGMLDGEAVPLAGGLEIVNGMKEGRTPRRLVMLAGIGALRGISLVPAGPAANQDAANQDAANQDAADHDSLDVAAMTTHDELARHPLVLHHLPDLAACWDRIANIRIRMQGTVAGNVLAANPGYDGAVLLAAAGARLVWRTSGGGPTGGAPDIRLSGVLDPAAAAAASGLVTAVRVPLPGRGVRRRLLHERSLRYALSLALGVDIAGDRVVAATAVLGGCHARPLLRPVAAVGLPAAALRDAAADLAALALSDMPPADVPWFGARDYRETMAPILLRRLIEAVAP